MSILDVYSFYNFQVFKEKVYFENVFPNFLKNYRFLSILCNKKCSIAKIRIYWSTHEEII